MKPDIEIARTAHIKPISEIAAKMGIPEDALIHYGKDKAKINLDFCSDAKKRKEGKLILVSATSPTPAGEGKTTTTIGLTDALNRLGKQTAACVREPSLGPVFGIKGGAAGGGYAQAIPMEDINLHFTGDMHAITSAHNTLAALVDNAAYRNKIDIDPKRLLWNRVMDVNDRSLREVILGMGRPTNGVMHGSSFDITAASEIMAILCLSNNIMQLKEKIGNILLGFSSAGDPVYCKNLGVEGSITVLLKDAIMPNLVQTIENNPVFIHGGPFANIAQGYNTIIAAQLAIRTNDIVITEAGFGSDLGAEKFFDLVSPYGGFHPDLMVLVTTIRALKMHGKQPLARIKQENLNRLEKGLSNLGKHLDNSKKYGMDCVVCLNKFSSDTQAEIKLVKEYCNAKGFDMALSELWEKGGEGGEELGKMVIQHLEEEKTQYHPLYDWTAHVEDKIKKVATEIYGADDVEFAKEAIEDIEFIKKLKLTKLPICIAKTQKSLSEDPTLLGAPKGWKLHVRRILIASGAGFLIPLTGRMLRMPGLPMHPAAENIDIDYDGDVIGLF
ncbi:MAG: formate--tetrahydrofolate ligase [Promethearchaeota archaeon]